MSENSQQNFKDFVKNLNDELSGIDQKYPDANESDNCAKGLEKLNVYTRFTTDLINSGLCYALEYSENGTIAIENLQSQNALNDVRNVLNNRIEMEEQAIDSLLKGKDEKLK